MKPNQPRAYILAGPNGAGKTTFAREYLTHEAQCLRFINADLIAQGLSPFDPQRAAVHAGRVMLSLMADAVRARQNFSIETTLAGRNFVRSIREWQEQDYFVTLFFLALPDPETAIERVAQRVLQGGHDVAPDVIRRRFAAGRANFESIYKPLVDAWLFYECMGPRPNLIAAGVNS